MRLFERYLLAGFDPSQLTLLELHRVRSIAGTILGLATIALVFLAHSLYLGLVPQAVTLVLGFSIAYFLVFHVRGLLWQINLRTSGDYWTRSRRSTPSRAARDDRAAAELWRRSEQMVDA